MADGGSEGRKKCFVVSSIGEADSEERIHLEFFFDFILKPVFAQFPYYELMGSNDIHVPGMIDGQIISHLLNDDLVIADMSFLNSNVFYEIGIRHFAQKPIIHTFRQNSTFRIPFDVQAFRAIEYSIRRPESMRSAQQRIIAQIQKVEEKGFEVDNPVTRAIGAVKIKQNATPAETIFDARISALEERLNSSSQIEHTYDGRETYPLHIISRAKLTLFTDLNVHPTQIISLISLVETIVKNNRIEVTEPIVTPYAIEFYLSDIPGTIDMKRISEKILGLPSVRSHKFDTLKSTPGSSIFD